MKPWHSLTYAQWIKLWDRAGWREKIGSTLREIARDPKAAPHDRLMALQTINEAITNEALPADPNYPELMRDVLLKVVVGTKLSFWERLGVRRHRKAMNGRLIGARWMLQTAYQIIQMDEYARDEDPQREVAPLKLLS